MIYHFYLFFWLHEIIDGFSKEHEELEQKIQEYENLINTIIVNIL
jgi:hypothetical protein